MGHGESTNGKTESDNPASKYCRRDISRVGLAFNGVVCLGALGAGTILVWGFVFNPSQRGPLAFVGPLICIATAIGVGRGLAITAAVWGLGSDRKMFRFLRPVLALLVGLIVSFGVARVGIWHGQSIVRSQFVSVVKYLESEWESRSRLPHDIIPGLRQVSHLPEGNDTISYYHSKNAFALVTRGPRLSPFGTLSFYYGPDKTWWLIDYDNPETSPAGPLYLKVHREWQRQDYCWNMNKASWVILAHR